MSYLSKGIEKTLRKRNDKLALLASIQTDGAEPPHGMTKEQAILMLSQDVADYDAILSSLRKNSPA